ncbi:hypothetical protein CspHIS471_0508010 [Cutaneotrichosporon sp. HIS471]|nr:hypothetical protein CspHIS471_0508010 [Cutaneotrichosporon sp. HIS471]
MTVDSHSPMSVRAIASASDMATFKSATSNPNPTETRGPMLDAAVFPHILDSVVDFASTESLVVLRQTCTTLRGRTRAMLYEHVLFLPLGNMVHILTALPPYLHLGTFEVKGHQVARPVDATVVTGLTHTRVLDLYGLPVIWKLEDLSMPRLDVIRRVCDQQGSKFRHRYAGQFPPAHTVVDYIDISERDSRYLCPDTPVTPPYGTKHHIVHLLWHQWDPRVPWVAMRPCENTEASTVVLHPYGTGDGPAQHFQTLGALLSSAWRGTIVGAERMYPHHKPAVGVTIPSSGGDSAPECANQAAPDSAEMQFETYDSWVTSFGRATQPAPETMAAFYESAKMRRSRFEAETMGPNWWEK